MNSALNHYAEKTARTVEAQRELGVQQLGPAHCTGTAASARLRHGFPQACTACSVGSRFVFQR
jgi:metal-dependent hydrolase (beta-lactamase superfamily II)